MEDEGVEEDALEQRLRDSRRRFQRRMQQLIEKYSQPFEDDPLVHMATLTYETPRGLRIWGGKLIKERSKEEVQEPPATAVDGSMQDTAEGNEQPLPRTQGLGADSESSGVDASLDQEDPLACGLRPIAPRSPLKTELRRKYLTQVDILLQDAAYFQGAGKGSKKDTAMMPVAALASPATPTLGPGGHAPAQSPGDPAEPAPSPSEWGPLPACQAGMAVAPGNASVSFLGASQSLEADDVCDVTICDLYAGMLHSMSRLLSTKPACIISTKTSIVQNWNPRRRLPRKSRARVNETYCQGVPCPRRGSKGRAAPCSEHGEGTRVLRDCKNVAHHETGLKSEKASFEETKSQIRKGDLSWEELHVTPRKRFALAFSDFNPADRLDQENRLMALRWLISPVKVVSRRRLLQSRAETRYREIEVRFDKLHRACCPYPAKQPLPADPWAVDVYRGASVRPGIPQHLETHGPRLPFSRAKAKSLNEALENLSKRSGEAGGSPLKSGRSSLSEGSPSPSPGHSQQTSDLPQRHSSGTFRGAGSPSKAVSGPVGYGRNRCDEIREKFDKLYLQCCHTPPRPRTAPPRVRASPGKAGAQRQWQTGHFLGKGSLDSCFQSLQNLSPSPQRRIEDPQGSPAVGAHPSAWSAGASTGAPLWPTKRRRLSEPPACGYRTDSQDSSGALAKPAPQGLTGERRAQLSGWKTKSDFVRKSQS